MSNRTARRGLLILGILGFVAVGMASDATAGATSRKMDKQIGLFEKMMDGMLVDSPNWLVKGRENTRGSYVDGHGLIVTFDATLVNWDMDYGSGWKIWKHHGKGHKGHKEIILEDEESTRDSGRSEEKWYEHELKRGERLYSRGKAEIVEVVVDFAEYLTELGDSDTIEIEAFLGNAPYFIENDLSTLVMTVRMSDVREFADSRIDEEAFVSRIETEEK